MSNIFLLHFLLLAVHATYTMDGQPPRREKKPLVSHVWQPKETPPTPSDTQKLSVPEEKRPKLLIHSAPPSLTAKTIDHSKNPSTVSERSENNPQKNTALPTIIATNSGYKPSRLRLEEMISAQTTIEERDTRSKDKRSKNTFLSRSSSPAKKEKEKNIQDKLSSSDPGKNIFEKYHWGTSPKKNPTKKNILPQKPPKHTQPPTDFKSALDAIHHEETNLIKDFLDNFTDNPNQCSSGELTLLHHAVLTAIAKDNASLVIPFLLEPRVNSLVKNRAGYAPYQLIIKDDIAKYKRLFDLLLLRARLDRIVHAMIITDEQLINKEYKDKVITTKIKALLKRIPLNILPSYADRRFILAMICSRLQYDLPIIKIAHYHYITNHNHQDEWGYTMLHHAAYLRDKVNVKELVENPNITSKRNKENFFPQGLIEPLIQNPEEPTDPLVMYTEEIRSMLFNRNSIDSWIEQELDGLLFMNPIVDHYTLKPDGECVQDIKKQMTEYFEKIAKSQKGDTSEENDRALPLENAKLPIYATDKFLLALLLTHMKNKKTKNNTEIEGFNPNPVFTESSESQNDKQEPRSNNLDERLSVVEKKIMEDIESGAIKPIGSDSSLIALDSSSSSTLIGKKS